MVLYAYHKTVTLPDESTSTSFVIEATAPSNANAMQEIAIAVPGSLPAEFVQRTLKFVTDHEPFLRPMQAYIKITIG